MTYSASEQQNRILEGDVIRMWGNFTGLKTYTSIFGQDITIPAMSAWYIDIL